MLQCRPTDIEITRFAQLIVQQAFDRSVEFNVSIELCFDNGQYLSRRVFRFINQNAALFPHTFNDQRSAACWRELVAGFQQ